MNQVFIIGAAGGVGRRLVGKLTAQGDGVVALHRQAEQAPLLRQAGAKPLLGDITHLSAPELATLMKGCQTVVFSAGAGGKGGTERTSAVDGQGLEKAVAAAQLAGVGRFLLVSVFPEAWRDRPRHEEFEHYMRVKKLADVCLAESPLDWVILRPGTLTDEPAKGVRLGLALPYGTVSRDGVAGVLAALVAQPRVSQRILEVTDGTLTPWQAVMHCLENAT
ncbi:SDR family oxidoreductase [Formicincola oecophyllae]|uniref:SDR family oxidoreductase n=1 Tax=Formicincola oecophyllae TaxID=2558361 RepID=A0A4Y6U812_9PROT|nr:SDR family oxidoreductase [Formicincola oecophyllae]QDH13569.1 SDR family oxidoreductase [Formicincola oecophyllae]